MTSFAYEGTALLSAARTATNTSADILNPQVGARLHLVLDVSAAVSSPSITLTIQGKDRVSGLYYTVLAGAAVTGVSTTVYKVGPSLTAANNAVANDQLPRTWRVSVAHGNADSITYSVGWSLA